MTETVRIGLLGAGRIGTLHGRHLATRVPGASLEAIADVHAPAAHALGNELSLTKVYDDPRRVLDDPAVDAVVICTSTDTHADLIEAAAGAGKHVFCEKPIDRDLARIDAALRAVAAAGVRFQVGFNRRFDPGFARAKELLTAGRVGQAHLLRITSRDPQPPPLEYLRVSGGLFFDMTIHDFDMARFLLGDVRAVYAVGAVLVDPRIGEAGDIDTALTTLHFESGALGAIDNSRRAVYGYDQRVEIFGSEGVIVVGNKVADDVVVSDSQGTHAALPVFFFMERYTDAYLAEMSAFVEAVREDREPPLTGQDGREPVVMAHAAERSYRESRPVALREVDPARA